MIYASAVITLDPHGQTFPPFLGRLVVEVPDDTLLLDLAGSLHTEVTGVFQDIVRAHQTKPAGGTASRHQFKPLNVGDLRVLVHSSNRAAQAAVTTAFRNVGIRRA